MAVTARLDLTGMKCPGPIVRLNTEFRPLTAGDECCIVADDPAFEPDLRAWCRRTGHELVSLGTVDGVTEAVVRVVR
jgi:TusA-related sulfurtransferase